MKTIKTNLDFHTIETDEDFKAIPYGTLIIVVKSHGNLKTVYRAKKYNDDTVAIADFMLYGLYFDSREIVDDGMKYTILAYAEFPEVPEELR